MLMSQQRLIAYLAILRVEYFSSSLVCPVAYNLPRLGKIAHLTVQCPHNRRIDPLKNRKHLIAKHIALVFR